MKNKLILFLLFCFMCFGSTLNAVSNTKVPFNGFRNNHILKNGYSIMISYSYPNQITISINGIEASLAKQVTVTINNIPTVYNNYLGDVLHVNSTLYPGLTIAVEVTGPSGKGNNSVTVGQNNSGEDYESPLPLFNYSLVSQSAYKTSVTLQWQNTNGDYTRKFYFYLYYRSTDGTFSNAVFGEAMPNDLTNTIEIPSPYLNGTQNNVRLIVSNRVLNDGIGNLKNITGFNFDYAFYVPTIYYTESFQISTPYVVSP